MAYRTEGDLIVLTMNRSDYEILLMMLGGAAAIAMEDRGPLAFNEALRFVNRVNQGNPNWIPYEVDDATQKGVCDLLFGPVPHVKNDPNAHIGPCVNWRVNE